ncbi:MAG TPA: hypothetical protein VK171_16225 [Fimbriimonas sp.]|nr:hypothetical protein [Fimbriimonas sp.]
MTEPPPLPHLVSNYPRGADQNQTRSLEVGKELLKAYYQCAAISFTMVGWFFSTLAVITCCVKLGADPLLTIAATTICLALTAFKLFEMSSQPLAALAFAGDRSPNFELRWKTAICLLGPIGLGLALIWMLRGRIVSHLEPYGVADDLTSFQEREVFVLLEIHNSKKLPEEQP